jgi:hypothetical protein
MCWAWRRATTAPLFAGVADDGGAPHEGGEGGTAVSLPVDTAARAGEEATLRSPMVAGPCSLKKLCRCSRRAALKKASRVWGVQERRPARASAAPSSNAFRAASEIFSLALAREIQRADSAAVN